MKKRISSFFGAILIVLSFALSGSTAIAGPDALPEGQLTGQIDYWFVGHLQEFDDQGRLLVWEGTINGDLNGITKWWFEFPSPVPQGALYSKGRFAFYAARWEIWVDGMLILAGESAGKTVFPDGEDGNWDGHGVVTEAGGRYNALKGRKISETGTVLLGEFPPVTYTGTGLFMIY